MKSSAHGSKSKGEEIVSKKRGFLINPPIQIIPSKKRPAAITTNYGMVIRLMVKYKKWIISFGGLLRRNS